MGYPTSIQPGQVWWKGICLSPQCRILFILSIRIYQTVIVPALFFWILSRPLRLVSLSEYINSQFVIIVLHTHTHCYIIHIINIIYGQNWTKTETGLRKLQPGFG